MSALAAPSLQSPAARLVSRLVRCHGRERAHQVLDLVLGEFTTLELAAIELNWRGLWARPAQIAPANDWISWGHYGARGNGKTMSISQHINEEVLAGRAPYIGLAAQNEDKTIDIQVEGKSGLIATAPPWFRPRYEVTAKQLVWPNGSRGFILTPEAPRNIRGPEYHLSWLSEVQSWPDATRAEAFANFQFSTRLGYARIVWDATPQRGHPILAELKADAASDPARHVIVRATTYDNYLNLSATYIARLEKKYGGTQKGLEELLGQDVDESEKALWKQPWIDRNRRPMPEADGIVRRILSVDPAVTANLGSDRTGISEDALLVDGKVLVIGDYSGKHEPHEWATIVLEKHVTNRCDLVIVETNKGGRLLVTVLRAAADKRGLKIVLVGDNEQPRHTPGIVHVKEIFSKGAKEDRAQPVATAYEANRVCHAIGADLAALELTLTSWEPGPRARSPDDLDALVAAVRELLRLEDEEPDLKEGFKGIQKMGRAIAAGPTLREAIASALRGGGRGDGKI